MKTKILILFALLIAALFGQITPGGGIQPVVKGGTGTANGSITGTGALIFAAGGVNQSITLIPSGTGQTIHPVGVVGAPGITFLGDLDTGIYWVASDQIGVVVAGVERMRVNSSGWSYQGSANGPQIVTTGASATSPTLVPNRASSTTGIGGTSGTISSIIAGTTAQTVNADRSITLGANVAAGATTSTKLIKAVSGIANAAATDVLTVTIPNAAHSASLRISLTGSLGAGGAIGANEATGTIIYNLSITRTAGVATVTTVSTGYGSATSAVAGGATITITAAATTMTGAVSATQTFTVQVTISRGSGSSTNHTCVVEAAVINANATGVSIL